MKMRTHVVIGVKHSEFPYRVSLNETSRDGGSRELSAIGAFATLFHARKFAKEIAKTYEVDVEEWID